MNQSYSHILTITFKHAYFEDELFRSLELSFPKETMSLLRDLELIIKPFSGGCHLLTANPELLASHSTNSPLQLDLFCKDPYFINYTVLPTYSSVNSLVYINNLEAVQEGATSELRLHHADYVMETDMFRVSNGQFTINQFDSNKAYVFKNAFDMVIPDQSMAMTDSDTGQISISDLPQGIVHVFDGDELVDSVYYNPKAVWKKPFGTIELFTKALYNHYKNGIKVDYAINFNNRKTIWKYFLIDKAYQKFNNLTIINSLREQIFEVERMDDKSLVFTSNHKLPISENLSNNFQLVHNFIPTEQSEIVIINNLPKASPEQLHYLNDTDDTMSSHIYI